MTPTANSMIIRLPPDHHRKKHSDFPLDSRGTPTKLQQNPIGSHRMLKGCSNCCPFHYDHVYPPMYKVLGKLRISCGPRIMPFEHQQCFHSRILVSCSALSCIYATRDCSEVGMRRRIFRSRHLPLFNLGTVISIANVFRVLTYLNL